MVIATWLDSALQDARYGLRQLRKTPALVLSVVLSLTIGVGANTAIFSLIDAAILKPLPVKDPGSLRVVEWTNAEFPAWVDNINGTFDRLPNGRVRASSIAANHYRTLAREQTVFESLMGMGDGGSVAVAVGSSPAEQASLQYVSSDFFQGLGTPPVIGRPFHDADDRIGAEPVVIVSHRFWMQRLGGGGDALDRHVRINNVPARIVGVAPRGFFGMFVGQWTEVYAPIASRVAFRLPPRDGTPHGEDDRDWWVRQIGRLKAGVPDAAAKAQITSLFRNIAAPPGTATDQIPQLIVEPGRRGFDELNPRDASALWILMTLVAVLLLIVCANVANLLLSRSIGRQRESAVRLALGASRTRLFRQHLVESGVLALLGGAAGLALGYVLAHSIHLLFQAGRGPSNAFDLHVDVRMLGYTGALSMMTALIFGLAPALRAAKSDLGDALKSQTRSVIVGRLRLPRLLVSIQIALCLTALVGAGLLGRSLLNLRFMNMGFDRERLAYASVNPWQAGYPPERVRPYVDRLHEELARIPGVVRLATVQVRPLQGGGTLTRANIPGRPFPMARGIVDESVAIHRNSVGEGFFETLGIPLVAGRTFDRRDIRKDANVVIVDELFARRFFPSEHAVGRRFGIGPKDNQRYEIVGVVQNSRYNSLRSDARPVVYDPLVPGESRGPTHVAIRSATDSARLAEAVRKAVAAVDPAVPLVEFHTQTALIDRMLRAERLLAFVSGAFGIVALTLAAIGLGGLLAYTVARRTNEIGVRMALGAAAGDVIRMVLRDALGMSAAGILIGLPCSYAIGKVLEAALFRLEPLDPRTTALSFSALLAVALLAACVPARRAARINPMTALREE